MAAMTALALASLAGSAFSAIEGAKKKPKAPPLPDVPAAPKPIDASAAITRAKATGPAGKSTTLLTGPRGLTQPAQTQGKTLLGL